MAIDIADEQVAKGFRAVAARWRSGLFMTSQRAAVAVEYERVFAVEAKKRQAHGQTAPGGTLRENLPEASADYHASDEAGDLFQVSGRSVRDAKYVAQEDPDTFEQLLLGRASCGCAAPIFCS